MSLENLHQSIIIKTYLQDTTSTLYTRILETKIVYSKFVTMQNSSLKLNFQLTRPNLDICFTVISPNLILTFDIKSVGSISLLYMCLDLEWSCVVGCFESRQPSGFQGDNVLKLTTDRQ